MFNIPTNVSQGLSLGSLGSAGSTNPVPMQNQMPPQSQVPMQNQMPQMNQTPMQNQMPQMNQTPMQNQMPQINQAPMQNQMPSASQGGGVVLRKGQKTSLSAMNPQLDMVDVCLGWDVSGNRQYDLDTECFMLGSNDKVIGDDWFVFYNQPVSPDGSVRHSGDNKTGDGNGDDEIIHIQLSRIMPQVTKLVFIVTINEAREQGLNFSGVSNAYIRVVDRISNREQIRFNLTDYYATVTSMMVGELYKHNNEWKFTPIGDGTQDDLYGLCTRYGVNIAG